MLLKVMLQWCQRKYLVVIRFNFAQHVNIFALLVDWEVLPGSFEATS
jgi:hypothetical protein